LCHLTNQALKEKRERSLPLLAFFSTSQEFSKGLLSAIANQDVIFWFEHCKKFFQELRNCFEILRKE